MAAFLLVPIEGWRYSVDLDEVLVKLKYGLDNTSVVGKSNLCSWCAVVDFNKVETGKEQIGN